MKDGRGALAGHVCCGARWELRETDVERRNGTAAIPTALEGERGRGLVGEFQRGVGILLRVCEAPADPFAAFRGEFLERYGDDEVPLAQFLDPRTGFDPHFLETAAAEPLAGDENDRAPNTSAVWDVQRSSMADRVWALRRSGRKEWTINEADIEALTTPHPAQLSRAFVVRGQVFRKAPPPPERFGVVLDEIRNLEAEACGLHGDGLLPKFRQEGPHWVAGVQDGAEPEHPPIEALSIALRGGRFTLMSRASRAEVRVCAGAWSRSLLEVAACRLVNAIQQQGVPRELEWPWGPLKALRWLPRVVFQGTILSRARWTWSARELKPLSEAAGPAAAASLIDRYRGELAIPPVVTLVDGNRERQLDLRRGHSATLLVDIAKRGQPVQLVECLDEVVADAWLPFEAALPPATARATTGAPKAGGRSVRRVFPPGSEWTYSKLYCGKLTSDRVLTSVIAPLMAELQDAGLVRRWFFLRYADPRWHLRVRCQSESLEAAVEVAARLRKRCLTGLSDDMLRGFELDTYQREVERYGGAHAIEIAEELFHIDSRLVTEVIGLGGSPAESKERRWQWALLITDRWLDAFGLDIGERHALTQALTKRFSSEFSLGAAADRAIGARFRAHRPVLESLLWGEEGSDQGMAAVHRVAGEHLSRGERLMRDLRNLAAQDQLTVPIVDFCASFVHMHINRMILSDQRRHELVIYSFLRRLYDGKRARENTRRCPADGTGPVAAGVEPAAVGG